MDSNKKTILLVEDEAIIALAEKQMLQKAGYRVIHALSGEKAVRCTADDNTEIDLVLMDIDLGKGIDGTEAAKQILLLRDVPIVFLSSHTEQDYVEKTDRISSYGYVVKNSGEMVLLRSITMAFRLHSANRELRRSNAAISSAERRYRLLFENLTAGYALHEMIYDDSGKAVDYLFLDVNPWFERITGLKAGKTIGKTVKEILPETEQYWIETYDRVVKTGESLSYENYSRELDRYYDVWAFLHEPGQFAVVISDITERRRAEERLRQQKEYLATTLDAIGDAVISTDRDTNILTMNPVAQKLTGWPLEQARGEALSKVFAIKDARTGAVAADPAEIVIRNNRIIELGNHTALVSRDGRRMQIADSAAPIRDEKGDVEGVVLVFRDVTEQYRITREIEDTKNYLESVVESVQEGISVLNYDLSIDRVNSTTHTWFPGESDFTGRKCYSAFRGRTAPCPGCPVLRCFESGKPEMSELQGSAGSPVEWIEAFAYPIIDEKTGRVEKVVEFKRDITARKKSEQELREREEEFRAIFENNHAVMLLIDPEDGSIVNANPAACRYYGWDLETIRGMNISQINTLSPEEIAAEMERARSYRKTHFDFRHRRADGSVRDVQVFSGPVKQRGRSLLYSLVYDAGGGERGVNGRLSKHPGTC